MTVGNQSNSFVTDGRIVLARNYADEMAAKEPWATAYSCAERAVRTVFGRWLLDPTAAVRPDLIPLYFQLINRVESRLGVHRRANRDTSPSTPAIMLAHAAPTDDVHATGAAAAIAG